MISALANKKAADVIAESGLKMVGCLVNFRIARNARKIRCTKNSKKRLGHF